MDGKSKKKMIIKVVYRIGDSADVITPLKPHKTDETIKAGHSLDVWRIESDSKRQTPVSIYISIS